MENWLIQLLLENDH